MKQYSAMTVYEASMKRIAMLFDEFDNVMVAFSGGKDSGICLNLCYDYAKSNDLLNKLSVYHMDYEAQYALTTEYVTNTFESLTDIKRYWLCMPVRAKCACRMDDAFWTPWAKSERDIWVRDIPDNDCVITEDNAQFEFVPGMTDRETQDSFARWFADMHGGKTAIVIGIRADESNDRYKLVTSSSVTLQGSRYNGLRWTAGSGNLYKVYPIYDWTVNDVWIANCRFGWKYNRLYDLYYQAGLTVNQMRVASPFHDCGMDTLKLYKVIDPNNWGKMVSRVNGVNFAGIYGGTTAMGWRSITLPAGHTWKSYCYFLLSTLDDKLRKHYERILATSIRYWCEKGGFVSEEIMDEVESLKTDYEDLGASERYGSQRILKFAKYPDDSPTKSFRQFPSYKRMCVCILKNDYYCTYMGFSKTQEAIERRKTAIEKYKNL